MAEEMPVFGNWKEAWEWHAQQMEKEYAGTSDDHLLHLIQQGQLDPYYQIWYSLRDKTSLNKASATLLTFLRRPASQTDDLHRYHCAAALFHLLGYSDDPIPPLRARVQWVHQGENARQEALDELEQLIYQHPRFTV